MSTTINFIHEPRTIDLYGFSGKIVDKNVAGTGKLLMDRMWQVIRSEKLAHKGINHWVYEAQGNMFVGVEIEPETEINGRLEFKQVTLNKYIYGKHVGPIHGLHQTYKAMYDALKTQGLEPGFPSLEIYGHWTADESKFETEILMALR